MKRYDFQPESVPVPSNFLQLQTSPSVQSLRTKRTPLNVGADGVVIQVSARLRALVGRGSGVDFEGVDEPVRVSEGGRVVGNEILAGAAVCGIAGVAGAPGGTGPCTLMMYQYMKLRWDEAECILTAESVIEDDLLREEVLSDIAA